MSIALSLLIKASIIAAIGLIASFRSRSAARAATIWRITFASIALLPLLSFALPSLDVAAFDLPHAQLASPLTRIILAVWILGSAIGLLRLLRDYAAACSLARDAIAVDDTRIVAIFASAANVVRTRKPPELRLTKELGTAALIGWRKPVILIPHFAVAWTDDELLGVFCHELEHLRHNDWIQLILERITVSLLWITPIVHFAFRSSSINREMLADDAVVRSSIPLESYAATLIAAAREVSSRPALSVAFSGRMDTGTRVRALFENERHRRAMCGAKQLVLILAATPLLLGIAAAEPWRCIDGTAIVSTYRCP